MIDYLSEDIGMLLYNAILRQVAILVTQWSTHKWRQTIPIIQSIDFLSSVVQSFIAEVDHFQNLSRTCNHSTSKHGLRLHDLREMFSQGKNVLSVRFQLAPRKQGMSVDEMLERFLDTTGTDG